MGVGLGWGVLGVAVGLAGCGFGEAERAREVTETVAETIGSVRPQEKGPGYAALRVVGDRPYVGLEVVRTDPRESLPGRWREAAAVTLPLGGIAEAEALAARLEEATGLEVRLVGVPVLAAGQQVNVRSATATFAAAWDDRMAAHGGIWTGPLDELLDAWTAAAGWTWRHAEDALDGRGRVEVVRRQSVVFRVHALVGRQDYAVSTSTQDQAAEGSERAIATGLTSQSITSSAAFDPWPGIAQQLGTLVGTGTRVSLDPASASVTVDGVPADIARVRGYLDHLNRVVLRPVAVSVHVYLVKFDRETDYRLGLEGLLARIGGENVEIEVTGAGVALVAGSAGSSGSGSSLDAAVEALSRVGSVSRVLSAEVPSMNGTPAQFFELFNEAYLAEQSTTVSQGVAQTEMKPGSVSSGFAVSYVPRVVAPDEVLLRLVATLQDPPTFRTFASGTQAIQLPSYGSRAIQVTQSVRRGETLMITGFADRSAEDSRSGTFDAGLPFPGGGAGARFLDSETVLMVTARIGPPLGLSETPGAVL